MNEKRKVNEEQTSQQLSAIAEVNDLLEEAGIAYWLFGGWAVDFYVGSVTRLHDDLDMAVWLKDASAIAKLLQESGWRHAPLDDEDGGTGYERSGVRLELTYLVLDDEGVAAIPMQSGQAVWPGEEGLTDNVRELRGVRARLIGFASLLSGKSVPRDDAEDGAKDSADFTQLSQVKA